MKPAIAFALSTSFACAAPIAAAADLTDTALAYRYGSGFSEPARPNDIAKHIPTLTHLNVGKTGIHFLSLEGRFSDTADPAKYTTDGADEYLFNYRWQLAAARVLDKPLAFGPLRDVAFLAGIDRTTKNTLFAPQKRAWMAGPVLKLDVPGFLDIGLLYYKERNHKGIPGTLRPDTEFDGAWMLNVMWGIPFRAGATPAVFQGMFNRVGEKGDDFDYRPTASETLLRTAVLFDIGQHFGAAPKAFLAGGGYEWWKNKYGTPPGVGTHTSTPTLNIEMHF